LSRVLRTPILAEIARVGRFISDSEVASLAARRASPFCRGEKTLAENSSKFREKRVMVGCNDGIVE
jgi:hypothetical protein